MATERRQVCGGVGSIWASGGTDSARETGFSGQKHHGLVAKQMIPERWVPLYHVSVKHLVLRNCPGLVLPLASNEKELCPSSCCGRRCWTMSLLTQEQDRATAFGAPANGIPLFTCAFADQV